MNWNVKKMWPAAALSLAAFTAMLGADGRDGRREMRDDRDRKDPRCFRGPVEACCEEICGPMPCPERSIYGPNCVINPPARPFVQDLCCCDNGEFSVTVAAFYWKATEDGLEYALENRIATNSTAKVNLTDAEFVSPEFKWEWGFKVGVGYDSTHDGWDLNLLWTHFHGRGHNDSEECCEAEFLLPIWTDFIPAGSTDATDTASLPTIVATSAESHWKVDLDLVDLELGREFWTSKFLTLRPHIGLRGAWIKQRMEIELSGGTFSATGGPFPGPFNDDTELKNEFKGVGVRGGLDTMWHFCGSWGFFGNVALSILYGRFEVDHTENLEQATAGLGESEILDTTDHFRASRAIADLAFGIFWNTLFQDNTYGLTLSLAWEHHLFFNQNQMWRVMRIGGSTTANSGQNVYDQRRGDLGTQGWTLTAKFTF